MTLDFVSRASTALTSASLQDNRAADRRSWWVIPLLVAVTVLAYRPSFAAPFTFDDFYTLFQVPAARTPVWNWQGMSGRPLGLLTFALNYQVGGFDPFGYHAVNLAIHVAAGLTLFGLARRTLMLPGIKDSLQQRSTLLAGAIALVWLVHPLQTQAVTYVVQRFESLMGLLLLLSMYCLLRGAVAVRGWPWYVLSLIAAWLGLQAKEPMIVLPLVALAYDRAFLAESWRQLSKRRWWVHLGLAILAASLVIGSAEAFSATQPQSAGFAATSSTPWQYLRSQAGVIVHYLRLAVWPDVLCIDYRWPIATAWPTIVVSGLAILSLLGLSFWACWRYPRLGFLGLAFFLLLALTSSIMPIDDLAVEHRMYLPLACVATLLVLAVDAVIARTLRDAAARRLVRVALLSAAVVGLALRTAERNRDYVDPMRLWSKAIAVNPLNDRAYTYVGRLHRESGRFAEAEAQFRQAMEINPGNDTARAHMGMLKTDEGKNDEAVRWYEATLQIRPNFVKVMVLLGNLHVKARRYDEAIALYRQATTRQPGNAEAWRQWGSACIATGDAREAVDALRTAVKLHPHDNTAAGRLAWVLATASDSRIRDDRQALELAEGVAQKTGRRDYEALKALAAAQASSGRFAAAAATTEVAQALAELADDQPNQDLLKSHLTKYRAGKNVDMRELFPNMPSE